MVGTTLTPRTYTSPEVADLAGVPYRRLDYWIRMGLLQPIPAAPGSGNPRSWPEAEAIKAVEFSRMLKAGISWAKAAELLRAGQTAALLKIPLPEAL